MQSRRRPLLDHSGKWHMALSSPLHNLSWHEPELFRHGTRFFFLFFKKRKKGDCCWLCIWIKPNGAGDTCQLISYGLSGLGWGYCLALQPSQTHSGEVRGGGGGCRGGVPDVKAMMFPLFARNRPSLIRFHVKKKPDVCDCWSWYPPLPPFPPNRLFADTTFTAARSRPSITSRWMNWRGVSVRPSVRARWNTVLLRAFEGDSFLKKKKKILPQ